MLTPAEDTPRSMGHPYVGLSSKTTRFPCHYPKFADEHAEIQIYPLLGMYRKLQTEHTEHHLAHGTIWASVCFFGNPDTFSTSKWLLKM